MRRRGRTGAALIGALLASLLAMTVGSTIAPSAVAHAASGLGAGGEYHPLPPARIYDTRAPGIGATPGAIISGPTGGSADVTVLGKGGVPADAGSVLAVAVSITVVNPTIDGYLQVYPTGSTAGISSVLNFTAGQTVPNLSVLTVGTDGKITIKLVTTANGTADVLVDIFGWFSTSTFATSGARLIPVAPGRIYDSRDPAFNASTAPLGANALIKIPIRGADATNPNVTDIVPNSPNVVGVVLNVTGINDSAGATNTFVSVLPEDPAGAVTTSNLNLSPGQVKANLVIVPVTNADGAIRIFNNAGKTHVAVDVVGYMSANQDPATRLGRVVPLTAPFRAFDTRDAAFGNVQLGPGQAETWSFSQFASSVTLAGQPVGNQIALIGNLTGTGLTPVTAGSTVSTYFTLYPDDVSRPNSSNINVTAGVNIPNMTVVKLGADDGIKAYNNAGYIHYLFDVSAVVLGE
ncbi:MAG: hypothetical protein JWM34_804 [Ilumatobacteraceae bacterium]|nr:hypothetical protein [Ilumatobacteraceae bacterium]